MNCDLHTHTNHSDGASTPAELVAAAKELNLTIALTDHNTVTGLPEFLAEADKVGVNAIAGTELSTLHGDFEFHLLGLFIKPEYFDDVEEYCAAFIKDKKVSNIDLCNKLNARGYKIDFADVKARNVKGNANRAHIAAELVKAGYVSSVKEAFENLLDEKCGLYVPPERLGLIESIRFLRSIEALPILAHPLKEVDPDKLRELLPALIDAGLVGIETMHPSYSAEDVAVSKQIISEFGILESGGSDYHGYVKPDVFLGVGRGNVNITMDVLDKLIEHHKFLYEKE